MAIVLRIVKGSPLTHAELDNNFVELRDGKLDKSAYTENSSLLIKNSAGNFTIVEVPASRIIGRLAEGEIIAMTIEQLKGLIAIEIADIYGLESILDAKSDDGHTHAISEVIGLDAELATKQEAIAANTGWGVPTGTADKTAFETETVSLIQLARRVKALIDTLTSQGLLQP